jgi:hypothetical protein
MKAYKVMERLHAFTMSELNGDEEKFSIIL